MKSLSVKEIHELSRVLVSVEYTEKVRVLLDQFEAGEIGLAQVLTGLRGDPGSGQARHPSSFL